MSFLLCYNQKRASFWYGVAKGRRILFFVSELLPAGWTNQPDIFRIGSGRRENLQFEQDVSTYKEVQIFRLLCLFCYGWHPGGMCSMLTALPDKMEKTKHDKEW